EGVERLFPAVARDAEVRTLPVRARGIPWNFVAIQAGDVVSSRRQTGNHGCEIALDTAGFQEAIVRDQDSHAVPAERKVVTVRDTSKSAPYSVRARAESSTWRAGSHNRSDTAAASATGFAAGTAAIALHVAHMESLR